MAHDVAATRRALAGILADSGPVHHAGRRDEREPIWLLLVQLDTLAVGRDFADCRMQIRLRYGGNGRFQEKFSQKLRVGPAPTQESIAQGAVVELHSLMNSADLNGQLATAERWDAERGRWDVLLPSGQIKSVQSANLRCVGELQCVVGAMLVFRWNTELPPAITIDILKLGLFDSVVSQACIRLPFQEGEPGAAMERLLLQRKESTGCSLFSTKKKQDGPPPVVGHLGMLLELRVVTLEELAGGAAAQEMLGALSSMLDMVQSPGGGRFNVDQDFRQPSPYADPFACPSRAPPAGVAAAQGAPMRVAEGSVPVVMGRPVPGTGAVPGGTRW